MKETRPKEIIEQDSSAIMQNSTPVNMFIACFFSCIAGIVLMALTGHYLLMAIFAGILVCSITTTALLVTGKIKIEVACAVPMVLLCFVYTPASWFTFDGLLGCTPYLSVLFATIITLTYYRRVQTIMLSLYAALMLGLIIHWLATWADKENMEQVINVLTAYVLAFILIVIMVEGVKRKNIEINRRITELYMHDDLTGLLNRRAIEQTLDHLEKFFQAETSDYAMVMLDIDQFKNINDLYGHRLGDSALKSVAACIRKSIRASDHAFRLGGDEFLLMLSNADKTTAHQICARIETALYEIQVCAFPVTVSMGWALRSESVSTTVAWELADQRMYQAKRSQNAAEISKD